MKSLSAWSVVICSATISAAATATTSSATPSGRTVVDENTGDPLHSHFADGPLLESRLLSKPQHLFCEFIDLLHQSRFAPADRLLLFARKMAVVIPQPRRVALIPNVHGDGLHSTMHHLVRPRTPRDIARIIPEWEVIDLPQKAPLPLMQQQYALSPFPGARSPTESVDVLFPRRGHPDLNHVTDIRIIHSSRTDIAGKHHSAPSITEFGTRFGSIRLALSRVHLKHSKATGVAWSGRMALTASLRQPVERAVTKNTRTL